MIVLFQVEGNMSFFKFSNIRKVFKSWSGKEQDIIALPTETVPANPARDQLNKYLKNGYYSLDIKVNSSGTITLPFGRIVSMVPLQSPEASTTMVHDAITSISQQNFGMRPSIYFRDRQTGETMAGNSKSTQLVSDKPYELILIPEDVTWRPHIPASFNKKPQFKYRVAEQK